jgi:hypothetical protein
VHNSVEVLANPIMLSLPFLFVLATSLQNIVAIPHARPFENLRRQSIATLPNSTQVDLGYEIYEGVSNSSTGLKTFKGSAPLQPGYCNAKLDQNPIRSRAYWSFPMAGAPKSRIQPQ